MTLAARGSVSGVAEAMNAEGPHGGGQSTTMRLVCSAFFSAMSDCSKVRSKNHAVLFIKLDIVALRSTPSLLPNQVPCVLPLGTFHF
jgi:hypothetical protein